MQQKDHLTIVNHAKSIFNSKLSWISNCFRQKNSLATCKSYISALMAKVERKNSWQMAEACGYKNPYSFQNFINRASWDVAQVQESLGKEILKNLGSNDSVMTIDETGFVKKGDQSAGVAHQYTGTVGKIENCQIGVFLGYSTNKGHTLLDRRLYLPKKWIDNHERLKKVGLDSKKEKFKTKIEQAYEMLEAAYEIGFKPGWITADCVYGENGSFRAKLEEKKQLYVLCVRSNHKIMGRNFEYVTTKEIIDDLEKEEWKTLSSGAGSKGQRNYKWCMIDTKKSFCKELTRFLLCRESLKTEDRTYYLAFAPHETTLEKLVCIAGRRWTVEECFKTAKSQVGLDQYEVRTAKGWYRHITLAMVAAATLLFTRNAFKQKRVKKSQMNEFKKKRGLLLA